MALHVNFLPPELLCAIFCLLPIRDLLQTGRVCTKWHKALQTVGCKVRKLTLAIGGVVSQDYPDFFIRPRRYRTFFEEGTFMLPRTEYPNWDFVHFKWLDLFALIDLTLTFPNVTSLDVALYTSSMYQLCAVTILLRLWQSNLVSFKLATVFDDRGQYIEHHLRQIPIHIYEPLFEAINSLSSLKHLSLIFNNTYFFHVQLDLPILAQLDRFDFCSDDLTDVLRNSFRAANNPRLRIRLDLDWTDEQFAEYRRMGQQFELISSDPRISELANLDNFCSSFTSLTAIHLDTVLVELADISIRNLFTNLAKLTQLVHLGLSVSFELFVEDEQEEEDDDHHNNDPLPLARLPSVKSLRLYAVTRRHDNLALLNLPVTMPNLEAICVRIDGPNTVFARDRRNHNYHCDLCDLRDVLMMMVPERVESCLCQVMLPLRECTGLRSILFSSLYEHLYFELTLEDLGRPWIFDYDD